MHLQNGRPSLALAAILLAWLLPTPSEGAPSPAGVSAPVASDPPGARAAPFYTLNVVGGVGGTVFPSGSSFRSAGGTVTIRATPSIGYQFVAWTGVGPGSYTGPNRSAPVTMNGNITQTATFEIKTFPLTMIAGAGGTVTPESGIYVHGTVVTIEALPDSGHMLLGWNGIGTGSYNGINAQATVTMNGPITQTATFTPAHTLTMAAGRGGTVYPGIGAHLIPAGGLIDIVAFPDSGYQFSSWIGTGAGSYTGTEPWWWVIMDGDITQSASFDTASYDLTMVAGPGGTVTPASGTYTHGSAVSIQAVPDPGFAFGGWTGVGTSSYTGIANPTTVTLYDPVTQTASFGSPRTLTMAADPGGTVDPAPGSHSFAVGTSVIIQAVADSGYAFTGWTGSGSGSYSDWLNPVTLTMSNDVTQIAHFAPIELVPLTMIADPGGSVSPASGNYFVGALVNIVATPNAGWVFNGWQGTGSGSYTGPGFTHTILIGGPITQTGTFTFPVMWPVTMSAGAGGTVAPASATYPNGASVQIVATPSPGYVFKTWIGTGSGSYSGTSNPATITVNGAITEGALFLKAVSIAITTSPPGKRIGVDGVDYVSPRVFDWIGSTLHTVNVDTVTVAGPGDRDRFVQWSDGPATVSRTIFVPAVAKTYTATYVHEYELDFQDPPEGTSQPGDGYRTAGSAVPITAVPGPGFAFVQWAGTGSGSYTGTANPATVTMNGPITQTPSFRPLGYEFSISASATDPLINADVPTGGVRLLHLWMVCSDAGISALEADVTGDLPVLGFAPAGGVLNIGTNTALLLAIPGCATTGAMLLGQLIVTDTGGTLCLGTSAAHGVLGAVDCVTFGVSTPQVTGFSSSGGQPCVVTGNACGTAIVPETAGETARSESAAAPPAVPALPMLPTENAFLGARPNPFAGRTDLHFAVAEPSRVALTIYDVTGRLVRRLADEDMAAGEHLQSWDGRGENGSRAAGGVYFVRLEIGSFRQTERIVLTRTGD
ncbi:MAG: InlB B-repeat-containing protein [Candidatus Eiseniibacteriota bacterium]